NCGLSSDGIERVVQPTVEKDGQKPRGFVLAIHARLDARIFRPALTALQGRGIADPAPKLSRALAKVDHELDTLIAAAFPSAKKKAA
ncbi:MAG TPA: hypothetical protein VH394_12945, partial [Thermoanaerobaculia bacterium]|nr:hypothetical protein [Thermoanaerobaculia bacterium]